MSCHEIEILFSAYIDGELRDSDTQIIKSHIGNCAECAKKIKEIQQVSLIASTMPEVDTPASLKDNILAKTVYRQTFADRLVAVLSINRIPRLAGALSILVLAAGFIWMYNPSTSDTTVNVSPGIVQSNLTPNVINKSNNKTPSVNNSQKTIQIAKINQNIRENKIISKQYSTYKRKMYMNKTNVAATIDVKKTGKKADVKIASSTTAKNLMDTTSIRKQNTDNVISDNPIIVASDTKKDDTAKIDIAVNEKPSEPEIRTAKILTAERENRLAQEKDALKEMRDKLRSRNLNRRYSDFHAQDLDDRTITVQIASMRF
ncbi:zf-HC2 domain-containing protein [uncultured Desulfobulbus sp.]|uniref:anti-sigma factor family protein n=1 Tax=uncultured Desulfobulbus sp. TaxID=239745 RepID=UPI0029C7E47A|nr:zf-HC2 domain-containing protein [uncultured Desulfobulbus sp.]